MNTKHRDVFEAVAEDFVKQTMPSVKGVEVTITAASIISQIVMVGEDTNLVVELKLKGQVSPYRSPGDFSFAEVARHGFLYNFQSFETALQDADTFFQPLEPTPTPEDEGAGEIKVAGASGHPTGEPSDYLLSDLDNINNMAFSLLGEFFAKLVGLNTLMSESNTAIFEMTAKDFLSAPLRVLTNTTINITGVKVTAQSLLQSYNGNQFLRAMQDNNESDLVVQFEVSALTLPSMILADFTDTVLQVFSDDYDTFLEKLSGQSSYFAILRVTEEPSASPSHFPTEGKTDSILSPMSTKVLIPLPHPSVPPTAISASPTHNNRGVSLDGSAASASNHFLQSSEVAIISLTGMTVLILSIIFAVRRKWFFQRGAITSNCGSDLDNESLKGEQFSLHVRFGAIKILNYPEVILPSQK